MDKAASPPWSLPGFLTQPILDLNRVHLSPQQQAEQRELLQHYVNESVQVPRGNVLVLFYCRQASPLSEQLNVCPEQAGQNSAVY